MEVLKQLIEQNRAEMQEHFAHCRWIDAMACVIRERALLDASEVVERELGAGAKKNAPATS